MISMHRAMHRGARKTAEPVLSLSCSRTERRPLGEIECALPALSGMAVDFHEGGTGLAQSKIDNFRVEVCSAP